MSNDQSSSFLGYLHSFRGFAIINISAIHVFGFSIFSVPGNDYNQLNPASIINELLFHNSTIYFALISGILFTKILRQKGYKIFFLNKFKYVLLPYIFLTLIFSIFDNKAEGWFVPVKNLDMYFNGLFINLLYGKALFVFWYIPVLVFLYMVTPLLDFILNKLKGGKWLMLLLIAAPLVIRRVELMEMWGLNTLSLQTMIYFTGAYAGGMYLASNLEENLQWINNYKWVLLFVVIVSSAGLLYAVFHKIDRFGFFSLMSTLYYMQKMAAAFLVILLFKHMGTQQPKWLRPVANNSFTIYFLHVFFLAILIGVMTPLFQYQKIYPFNGIIAALLLLVLSIGLSMVTGWVFKKIFGKYSRMLVGS